MTFYHFRIQIKDCNLALVPVQYRVSHYIYLVNTSKGTWNRPDRVFSGVY